MRVYKAKTGSQYYTVEFRRADGRIEEIKVRISDHPQVEGGGWHEGRQERMGNADVDIVGRGMKKEYYIDLECRSGRALELLAFVAEKFGPHAAAWAQHYYNEGRQPHETPAFLYNDSEIKQLLAERWEKIKQASRLRGAALIAHERARQRREDERSTEEAQLREEFDSLPEETKKKLRELAQYYQTLSGNTRHRHKMRHREMRKFLRFLL